MPTYDYICSACGHETEVVHGVHGHGPSACPVCGGPIRKSFTAPAIHFKGSGWAKKERGGGSHGSSATPGARKDGERTGSGSGGESGSGSGAAAGAGATDERGSGSGSGGTATSGGSEKD